MLDNQEFRNQIQALNEKIAKRLAPLILSMSIFYFLTIGFIVCLVDPAFRAYFQAFSSNWYQGIALPIIGVSGAIAAKETMLLIKETHDAVIEILGMLTKSVIALHEKQEELHKSHKELHAKQDRLHIHIVKGVSK